MRFEFATATRIVFGAGTLGESGPLVREMGQRALVVTGRSQRWAQPVLAVLQRHAVTCVTFAVAGEPTISEVEDGARRAHDEACDVVVGVGGGSAIDAGKAIAALLGNGGSLIDYLEVIGSGRALTRPPAPFAAIPTTAGTGAEVTRNAVLSVPSKGIKASMRSPLMLPRLAIVDPELTCTLPRSITAYTGLDALTQLVEPYLSARANPITDGFCLEGMRRVARSLRLAWKQPGNLEARADMALAGLFGGLALANAGLGAVHGLAAPIGGMFNAPHGAVCAALLPHVLTTNLQALRERQPSSESLIRLDTTARILTGDPGGAAEGGVAAVAGLCSELEVPRLAAYGARPADVPAIVERAMNTNSMRGNPILLTARELAETVTRAL
jgi:alcohol dehydrogenase class IV